MVRTNKQTLFQSKWAKQEFHVVAIQNYITLTNKTQK